MRLERLTRLAAVWLLALVIAPPAWAQEQTGQIGGVVKDSSGAVLAGVTVEVTDVASGAVAATVVTDPSGVYRVPGLRPAKYAVLASLPGFTPTRSANVDLRAGQILTVDLALATVQATKPATPSMEIYGFAMMDIGHDFRQINPNWSDTLRVTRLPKFEDEFGENNNTFAGVRQSRLGVRSSLPTDLGELQTTFEFELFGTGVDEGQTTFRLRHAYGEIGAFGAGQYWSPFMDINVFPNSLEYWGPTGMVFFRNVHVRWMPVKGTHEVILALERPGASGDQGVYDDRVELDGIRGRSPLPDFSGAYKFNQDWGYLRAGWMLRSIKWDDTLDDQFDLSGSATGWGINLSSNLKASDSDVIRLQFVFGEGIQNYMNDSPIDIGIVNNFQDPVRPVVGEPIPLVGIVAFLDHTWNEKFSTAIGYSYQDNDNTDGQAPDAFRVGHYALGNLLYTPATNVMVGAELQWGRRENFSDGFQSDGLKLQFSFKYNFSYKLGGQ